jgi:flagellar hook-length control protein FliK
MILSTALTAPATSPLAIALGTVVNDGATPMSADFTLTFGALLTDAVGGPGENGTPPGQAVTALILAAPVAPHRQALAASGTALPIPPALDGDNPTVADANATPVETPEEPGIDPLVALLVPDAAVVPPRHMRASTAVAARAEREPAKATPATDTAIAPSQVTARNALLIARRGDKPADQGKTANESDRPTVDPDLPADNDAAPSPPMVVADTAAPVPSLSPVTLGDASPVVQPTASPKLADRSLAIQAAAQKGTSSVRPEVTAAGPGTVDATAHGSDGSMPPATPASPVIPASGPSTAPAPAAPPATRAAPATAAAPAHGQPQTLVATATPASSPAHPLSAPPGRGDPAQPQPAAAPAIDMIVQPQPPATRGLTTPAVDTQRLDRNPQAEMPVTVGQAIPAQPPVARSVPAVPLTQGPAMQVFSAAIAAARRDDRSPAELRALDASASNQPMTDTMRAVAASPDAQQAPLDMRQERWPHAMIDRITHLRDTAAAIAASAADTRIRLVPDALGTIDVSITRDGDSVAVRFQAEHAATRALLQDQQGRLSEIAESRGLRLSGSSVDAGSANAGQQQQQQAARQSAPLPSAPPRASTSDTETVDTVDQGRVA